MTTSWAYIYRQPGTDPDADRLVIDRGGLRAILVPVAGHVAVPELAIALVDEGVQLIELCGGFSVPEAARVVEAVAGRVPVGHVTFGLESIPGAAAFGEAAASAG